MGKQELKQNTHNILWEKCEYFFNDKNKFWNKIIKKYFRSKDICCTKLTTYYYITIYNIKKGNNKIF